MNGKIMNWALKKPSSQHNLCRRVTLNMSKDDFIEVLTQEFPEAKRNKDRQWAYNWIGSDPVHFCNHVRRWGELTEYNVRRDRNDEFVVCYDKSDDPNAVMHGFDSKKFLEDPNNYFYKE
jgi:hypothetical protein